MTRPTAPDPAGASGPALQPLRGLGAALRRWRAAWTGAATEAGPTRERWVLVDVETSGLDVHRDALLAIAAVGLDVDWTSGRLVMRPGDSLALDLQPERVSGKDNILLHGIGVGRQRQGLPPAQGLALFRDWVGTGRLVAFHAAFDQALLARDCRRYLGAPLPGSWLDIAPLCAVSHPQVRARSLDEWMDHFGIRCAARHEATADVLAEAELLQTIWPRVAAECRSWRAVQRYAARQAWIAGR